MEFSIRLTESAIEDLQTFVLEEADAFEQEVAMLGKSEKFTSFLHERSKEPATRSLDDYRRSLGTE